MKFTKTPPTNSEYYNRYIRSAKTTTVFALLGQTLSAVTEFTAILILMRVATVVLSPGLSGFLSWVSAIAGTFLIEFGVFSYLPSTCKGILDRDFKNSQMEVKQMFWIGFAICLLLCFSSMYLSFSGSKSMTENYSEKYQYIKIDSTDYLKNISQINARFTVDTLNASSEKTIRISSLSAKKDAKIGEIEGKIKQVKLKEKNTGSFYPSEINQLKTEKQAVIAVFNDSLLSISARFSISDITAKRNNLVDAENHRFSIQIDSLKSINLKGEQKTNSTISAKGLGLAWLTIIAYILVIGANYKQELFNKGAGINTIAMPSQRHFDQNVFSRFLNLIKDRFINSLASKLAYWESQSEQYPIPIPPQDIHDMLIQFPRILYPRKEPAKTGTFAISPLHGEPAVSVSVRVCACEGCNNTVTGRKDKKYCSDQCRANSFKKRNDFRASWDPSKKDI